MALQEGKDTDLTTQLMQFRTAYLQGVARAAVDLEFRRKLTRSDDALHILGEQFGYRCPWQLSFVVRDDIYWGPRYNPAKGAIMRAPLHGETLTVYLPKRPEASEYPGMRDDEYRKTLMEALAAFYQQNWQLLQNRQPGAPNQPFNPPDLPAVSPNGKWSSVLPTHRYDLGDSTDDFISFAAVVLNALALAWNDQAMWQELTREQPPPRQDLNPDVFAPLQTAPQILKQWFDYDYPWDIQLVFKPDPRAKYVKNKDDGKYKWRDLSWPELMLVLPWMSGAFVEPPSTAANQAEEVRLNVANIAPAIMGLALYNTDGPGYPFTCG
ncbi:BMA_0021/BMA_0022 family TOMM bacteriocin [Pendulispora albinea]|uniref:BMA_0021/BMA_0022 family TOMM bacteriocin n=1 Tax=Pendulispora albinea TaxID=2741071 RepID=A0ABZ2M7D8_9BACT